MRNAIKAKFRCSNNLFSCIYIFRYCDVTPCRRRLWHSIIITNTPGSCAPTICGREAQRSRTDSFARLIFLFCRCKSYYISIVATKTVRVRRVSSEARRRGEEEDDHREACEGGLLNDLST